MTDTFDAVLAEGRNVIRDQCGDGLERAAFTNLLDRLATAHAAELQAIIRERDQTFRTMLTRAEAASGQGVAGWTIQVKRGGPDNELGIWAVDPEGSSIWLAAPTQEKGNG